MFFNSIVSYEGHRSPRNAEPDYQAGCLELPHSRIILMDEPVGGRGFFVSWFYCSNKSRHFLIHSPLLLYRIHKPRLLKKAQTLRGRVCVALRGGCVNPEGVSECILAFASGIVGNVLTEHECSARHKRGVRLPQ